MSKSNGDDPDPADIIAWLKPLVFAARCLRPLRMGKAMLRGVRGHILKGTVGLLHTEFSHRLREFAVLADRDGIESLDFHCLSRIPLCCCKIVGQVLEIDPADLHCTIKLLARDAGDTSEDSEIFTIARSARRNNCDDTHFPKENSAFAALLGCSDGTQMWNETFRMFSCPDLTKHDNYVTSREGWSKDYKASIVLPLRYTNPEDGTHKFFGFMTFDSMNTKAFKALPDIFNFKQAQRKEYLKTVAACPITHVFGLMADTLSSVLFFLTKPSDAPMPELPAPQPQPHAK